MKIWRETLDQFIISKVIQVNIYIYIYIYILHTYTYIQDTREAVMAVIPLGGWEVERHMYISKPNLSLSLSPHNEEEQIYNSLSHTVSSCILYINMHFCMYSYWFI
jgi:hypothetical protein